jgi:hypothetical protein
MCSWRNYKGDKYRVDIEKLKVEKVQGEAVTGRYILKIDTAVGMELNDLNSFSSKRWTTLRQGVLVDAREEVTYRVN